MKPSPQVIMTQSLPRLRRRDIIAQDQLWMITDQGRAISIAVIDENIAHWVTPRYVNTVYSQLKSAQNACARLNQAYNTDRFEVRAVTFQ